MCESLNSYVILSLLHCSTSEQLLHTCLRLRVSFLITVRPPEVVISYTQPNPP